MSRRKAMTVLSFNRGSRVAFLALAFLLILGDGLLAILLLNDERRANTNVERTLQVTLLLQRIEDLATRAGRDQRAYRIAGDRVRLEAFRQEAAELPQELADLGKLVVGNGHESAQQSDLFRLVDEDLSALAATLTPISTRFEDGRLPPEITDSIHRSAVIVAAVDTMASNEAGELRTQLAAIDARNAIMLGTVGVGAFGGVILLAVIVRLLRGETQRTQRLAAASTGALEESEQRFRRIFEESPLGIVLARRDDLEVVQANPAFRRMIAYPTEQIVGRTITDMTHINDRESLLRASTRAGETGRDVEVRFVTGSAVLAWAHISLSQLGPSGSRHSLLLALVEDITRERRVEAELRQAQKMEAIGQLTGGIAHDFNNLLGVIIGNAEFLLDALREDPSSSNLAQEILDSALSGADLTRRLLAFARRQALQPRRIALNAYLPNHVAIIRRLLGETIQISVSLAEDLWPTRADPSQVGDALLNLAINARDAMPHGGRIGISTANVHLESDEQSPELVEGDYVVLSVADTGTGMPLEVLERALEPFFTTKEPGAGSGLGLSMIFGFAKQSGGHLAIDSQPGGGTTVHLYLPRVREAAAADPQHLIDPAMPVGRESVLLVDDNAEMRSVARRHLSALGYRVREAANGPAAVDCLREGKRFDLLFTDVIMPDGMTGYQLAAVARQMQPGLKVLFTTGYARPVETLEQSDRPLGRVLRKPYRKLDLAMAVREVLEA
jgi:PAS domain S-box-containing protein